MEEILNELITTLEEMSDESTVLAKMYKEYITKDIYELYIEEEFIGVIDSDIIESAIDLKEIKIEDFEPNEKMLYLYYSNLEKMKELENYALKLYRLFKKDEKKNIPYYEHLEHTKVEQLKLLKEKDLITVLEFTELYNYSPSAQKGFRAQLNNPIPYVQKKFGAKVFYKVREVEEWLNTKNRLL